MKKLIQKIVHSGIGRAIIKELVAILLVILGKKIDESQKIPDNMKPIVKDIILNTTPDIVDHIIDGKEKEEEIPAE